MRKKRLLAILCTLIMLVSMLPIAAIVAAAPQVFKLENIGDQTARIIQASTAYPNSNRSVNWGAEPIVLTVRVIGEDYEDVQFDLDIEDPTLLAGSFSGLNSNVLTLVSYGETGYTNVTVTARKGALIDSQTFKVTVSLYEDTGDYDWSNLKIPGAGAVCGYIFHPTDPNILYAQTDVGGAHRFNFETNSWEDITQWITPTTQSVGQSRGLGIDPTPGRENWVYLSYGSGQLLLSKDRGDTWINKGTIGISMGGNSGNLRGLGGDNIVAIPNLKAGKLAGSTNPDDYNPPTIYAVSNGGIRMSTDDATTWTDIKSNFGSSGIYTFVVYDGTNTNFRVVGAAANATTTADNGIAYYSANGGTSWAALPGKPTRRSTSSYYFPTKAAFAPPHNEEGDRYLFVTYNDSGSNTAGVNDGNGADGAVFRWLIGADGAVKGDGVNVTPVMIYGTTVKSVAASGTQNRMAGVGMAGLSVDPEIPGALIVATHNTDPYNVNTTLTQRGMETIFRSLDYGETWFPVLAGYNMFGDLRWGDKAPYAGPAVNGELNTNRWDDPNSDAAATQVASTYEWEPWTFLHWSFGPKINPHNSNMLMLNSGLGTFVSYNLTALDNIAKTQGNTVPNAKTVSDLSDTDAKSTLFTTTTGKIDSNRKTSNYSAFRIQTADFPSGGVTAATSVKWETAPDLFMTVQKASGMYSPPSGKNIALTNTWDYPGWAFQSTDHLPWNGWSYARWIDPKWNYLFDGTDGSVNWLEYTNKLDPKYLPPKPNDGKNYTIYAPTNRGISGDNTDYPDGNPDILVSTARTDWHFNAKGGPIISFDGGLIWHNIPDGWVPNLAGSQQNPPGYALLGVGHGVPDKDRLGASTTALKTAVNNLKGNDSAGGTAIGWVTIGADAKTLFWGIGNNQYQRLVGTKADDPIGLGQNWFYPRIWTNAGGTTEMTATTGVKIIADRVDPDVFYAFSTALYVSKDGGNNFYPVTITNAGGRALSMTNLNQVADAGRQIRGEVGNTGVFWIDGDGLFKFEYDKATNTAKSTEIVTTTINSSKFGMSGSNGRAGLGLGPTMDGVVNVNGALYAHGRINPQNGDSATGYGVYRSLDGGKTWVKISQSVLNSAGNVEPVGTVQDPYDNRNFSYSDVRSVTGDPRTFGRVYLSQGNVAGGSRYGDMIVNLLEDGATIATVQFKDHQGNLTGHVRLSKNSTATAIDAPVRTGWHFDGWYTASNGDEEFDFDTPIVANMSLYAQYTKIPDQTPDLVNLQLAQFYASHDNAYNAVYYYQLAISNGDTGLESEMSAAAGKLQQQAKNAMEAGEFSQASSAYQLLSNSSEVPSAISTDAAKSISASQSMGLAWYYYGQNNLYNAVYYLSEEIGGGNNSTGVNALISYAAKQLQELARGETEQGQFAAAYTDYQLLASGNGVPTGIVQDATSSIATGGSIGNAWFYLAQSNWYNTVYWLGNAMQTNSSTGVSAMMSYAAKQLQQQAQDKMTQGQLDQGYTSYALLATTAGVPTVIAQDASKSQDVSDSNYGVALWYLNNSNYINAKYYLQLVVANGNNSSGVQGLLSYVNSK
ncbi:MAG: InlB B-repeat-containing protein [Candidatus Cohnella colombiensis]|uniref:InlB B-repeat-containing protein n=1 Tax=Candidatus Cohnella colombiensis TaxID=3121368 RepID=A0AA95JAI8_9BACL|nr:MAG: InlB B-repeat-containing protein [Cohnella sp.]